MRGRRIRSINKRQPVRRPSSVPPTPLKKRGLRGAWCGIRQKTKKSCNMHEKKRFFFLCMHLCPIRPKAAFRERSFVFWHLPLLNSLARTIPSPVDGGGDLQCPLLLSSSSSLPCPGLFSSPFHSLEHLPNPPPFPSSSPSPSHLSKSQFCRSSNRIPPRPTRRDRRRTGGESRRGEKEKEKRIITLDLTECLEIATTVFVAEVYRYGIHYIEAKALVAKTFQTLQSTTISRKRRFCYNVL